MKEGNQDSNQQFGAEEEINIQPEQNEETRIQKKKKEERLRNLQDIFKCSNIQIIGVPKEKSISTKQKIMKENFPNLAKEIRLPGSPRSSLSPKEVGPKQKHTKTS